MITSRTPSPRALRIVFGGTMVLGGFAAYACASVLRDQPSVRHVDLDGDGRTDVFHLDDGDRVHEVLAPPRESNPPRTVILAIDAIPYDLFAALQRAGHFRAFFPAARMLAPFPSLTDVGFTAIFRTPPSAAYEDRFFDRRANRIGGGLGERLSGEYKDLAPFHAMFDWEPPRFWGGFVYVEPERIALAELDRIAELLEQSDDPELVLYLGATDGLGHEEGWEAMATHLRRIDAVLDPWLAAGGGSRRVVLFSDHGLSRGPTRRFDLDSALKRGGFRLNDRLDTPRDVVAPAYGLVGSIQLYTACGAEADVARAVVAGEGADFAVWRVPDGFAAVDTRGPTDLTDRADALYPELERRVAEGVRNHTRHPASVLVSLDEGWHYGLSLFEPFVSMEGTHGSARHLSSVGFLASNVDPAPDWVRAEEVWPYLGLGERSVPTDDFVDPCLGAHDGAGANERAESDRRGS